MCISIKLDDIVNDYINTYHRTMKPVDVKDNTYIDSSEKVNDKDPKFKNADHVKISKYKRILLKDTLETSLKIFLWLKMSDEIIGTFWSATKH